MASGLFMDTRCPTPVPSTLLTGDDSPTRKLLLQDYISRVAVNISTDEDRLGCVPANKKQSALANPFGNRVKTIQQQESITHNETMKKKNILTIAPMTQENFILK